MAKNSKTHTKLALSALAVGTAFTAANDANALGLGCQDANFVRHALLNEENQFVLVTGIRPIPEQPREIFTSNPTGTVGYNIAQGTGNTAGQLCVLVKYTDIHVNTNPDLSTPSWALMGANTAHDQWLRQTQSNVDNRVLLGARVLVNGQDNLRGGFLMVTRGNVEPNNVGHTNAGAITLSFSNGSIDPFAVLANVEKQQPNYDAFASRGNQPVQLDKK